MSTEIDRDSAESSRLSRPMTPERGRRLLERLDPTFVRLGQYLSIRPDLIPAEFCIEFLRLSKRITPFPFETVRQIISEDLESAADELFSWISARPTASDSFTQVHRAQARNRSEVTVKVERPGVREHAERSLTRARSIGRILGMMQANPDVAKTETVDDFRKFIQDELDFSSELRNIATIHERCAGSNCVRIPRAYPHLSGKRTMTTEFVSGVPLMEVLSLNQLGRLRALRIDPGEVSTNLLRAVVDQIFRLEFFNTDLHPGNLLVTPDNRIAFLNYGHMERVEPHFRQGMARLLAAAGAVDSGRIFDAFTELLVASERTDFNQFRSDFYDEIRRSRPEEKPGTLDQRLTSSAYLMAALHAARRNHFRIPTALLSACRNLQTAETLSKQLLPDASLAAVAMACARDLQMRSLFDAFRSDNLQPAVLDAIGLISEGPRSLRRLLADLADGRFVLRVRTVESQGDRQEANSRAQLISLSIVSVGLAFLVGTTKGVLLFGRLPMSWLLWASLGIIWGWIILHWRDLQR